MGIVKVKFLIEKSDHNGYCSDSECYYSVDINKFYIQIDTTLSTDVNETIIRNKIIQVTKRSVTCEGSGYCNRDEQCEERGLSSHDERITIIEPNWIEDKTIHL